MYENLRVSYEVRGREHLPSGGCVIAMKHQSVWDTCAMFAIFERPVYVLKSELMFIPFFGWALARLGCIPVKRGTGKGALDTMVRGTQLALAKGKQVVIFPKAPEQASGRRRTTKRESVTSMRRSAWPACRPRSIRTYWPRRSFLRPPGVITVELLPADPPGLDRRVMFERLVNGIEGAAQRLCVNSRAP